MIEKSPRIVVSKEFLAHRGATPVLFPVGCEIVKIVAEEDGKSTFLPLGETASYAVDRAVFESSVRRVSAAAAGA